MMLIDAGRCTELVDIQERDIENTTGSPRPKWKPPYLRRWMEKVDMTGREYAIADRQAADITTSFRARWDAALAAVKPTGRILHGGAVYEIVSVLDGDPVRESVEILCKRAQ